MKKLITTFVMFSFISCSSTRNEKENSKDSFEKYNYVNVSKEENLFYNQAAWYLKMEHKEFGILTTDNDSISSVFTMFSAKSPLIAIKLRFNNDNYSRLFRLKNGKLDSKVYLFNENDSLVSTMKKLGLSDSLINQIKTDSSLYNPPFFKDVLKAIFKEQENKIEDIGE